MAGRQVAQRALFDVPAAVCFQAEDEIVPSKGFPKEAKQSLHPQNQHMERGEEMPTWKKGNIAELMPRDTRP